MNERILELFKQAGGKTSVRNLTSNPVQVVETHELWDDRIEKFAELIVKECMNLCSEVKEDLELIPDKLTRDAAEMGVTFCYEAIKGEFGVEE